MNYEELTLNEKRMALYVDNIRDIHDTKRFLVKSLAKKMMNGKTISVIILEGSRMLRDIVAMAHKLLKECDEERLSRAEMKNFRHYLAEDIIEDAKEEFQNLLCAE